MGIVFDTSVIVSLERQVITLDQLVSYGDGCISSVTISELLLGVYFADHESRKVKRSAFVENIVGSMMILPFGEEEARVYAEISAYLKVKGVTIGIHNLMIGATAIASGCKILTMNEKDFKRIPGLDVLSIA